MRRVFNFVAKTISGGFKWLRKMGIEILHWIPASTISDKEERRRSIEEKRERKRAQKEAKKAASWLDEDFWEGHVLGREKDYRLPPQNRRSVRVARRKMDGKEEVDTSKMWSRRKGKV